MLKGAEILLPDHYGGIIRAGLEERGFKVRVLRDRLWCQLSDRIRVMCIADYSQDAVLLVDINGQLIADFNDADDHGWGNIVKRIIRRYDVSFMLHLAGFGHTDLINFYREDGTFVTPRAAKKRPVGRSMANWAHQWGTRYTIPFSSMHVYQRNDTVWADKYSTKLPDYRVGWDSKTADLLPAFIQYDVLTGSFEEIRPQPNRQEPLPPEHFGDHWSEPMEAEDRPKIDGYFKAISHLETAFDFIRVRLGGIEHVVELNRENYKRGLTFEAPRHSFMTSIEHQIFDDMLIGNIMKVTLHGRFSSAPLYPDFTPYVIKYSDNGRARSEAELDAYFAAYRARYPLGYLRHAIESRAVRAIRYSLEEDGTYYRECARTYHWLKRLSRAADAQAIGSVRRKSQLKDENFSLSTPAHANI